MPIDLQREGRLLRLTLNRPEKRNALDVRMCREIVEAIARAGDDPQVGAILLAGAGKAFCAGMDLSEAPDADPNELADAHDRLFTLNEWAAKPLIACVHGAAIAGGTGLAANAHIVIASEDARFGLTEVRLGLWPVLIFPAMIAAVGERRATELALTGRLFGAREAERYGIVHEVAPLEHLPARATEIALAVADGSETAIRLGLQYTRQIRGKATEALRIGREVRDRIIKHEDFAEGVRAFRAKRPPLWPSHGKSA